MMIDMHDVSSGDGATPDISLFQIGDDEQDTGPPEVVIFEEEANGGTSDAAPSNPNEPITPPPESQYFTTSVDLNFAEGAIVAPCDLPEGRVLRVDMGRGRILVTQIPYGGVREGETFYAPYRVHEKPPEKNQEYPPVGISARSFTTERWRVSLFGCCEYGPCHPSFLGAFCYCCQCFLLSQIMARMNLNWIGLLSPPSSVRKTMDGVFLLFAIFFFFQFLTVYYLNVGDGDGDGAVDPTSDLAEKMPGNLYAITLVVDVCFVLYVVMVTTRGRRATRGNYSIPGTVLMDCVVAFLCFPCSLSQMARQSADYRSYSARWCTDTGLSEVHDEEYGLVTTGNRVVMDRDAGDFL